MFLYLCFCISLFWPGMVLNQGQLSSVVSDWEPYLGSFFPQVFVGSQFLFSVCTLQDCSGYSLVYFCFSVQF